MAKGLGRWSWLLGAAVLTASCDATSARDEAGPISTDSAGVRIVESVAPAWDDMEAWSLSPEPLVEIGLLDGPSPFLFLNIEGALLLPDGRIAVADRQSAEIRFFDRSGSYLGFVGGPGNGPGELDYIRGIGLCGADSLFVFEIDYNTVVFSPEGEYVRESRPYDADANRTRRPYTLECTPSGHRVAVGWEGDLPDQTGFYRADAPAWVLEPFAEEPGSGVDTFRDAGLRISAELGRVLSGERLRTVGGSGPHPFGRATRFAISPSALYLGSGEAYEVRRYALDGSLEGVLRWSGPDLRITDAHLAAFVEETYGPNDELTPGNRLRRDTFLEGEQPPAFPTFTRLELDPADNLWAESFRRPGEVEHSWTVLGPDGGWLGTVEMPPDFTVTDIGDDVVLGVSRDALDVERVRLYQLEKR